MKCSMCRHLDLSTPISRRTAAIGYAVCELGLRPKDDGFPNLQSWPLETFHSCPKGERLEGRDKEIRAKTLKNYRDYLERKR